MPHVPLVSNLRGGMASRRFGNPGTGGVDEGYNHEHDCRWCENLVHKDDFYRCGLDLLGRKYRGFNSLKGTYPRDVAAACESYSKGDRVPREEG